MPNYGIARGSIFAVWSDATPSTATQYPPLQKSLGGVTIEINVGGVTTEAIPYFVSSDDIIAILPSATPAGTGTITMTSGGRTGSARIRVVESAFALMALQEPFGIAVAENNSEGDEPLSATNAANPGETVTLFGSGLGPSPGDETQYQTPADLTDIPVEVDIGGVSATVTFHGRTVYPGLDQIQVIVPAGVSGCNVSVVVTASGAPSNFATIPVGLSGRVCSDDPALAPVTPEEIQSLASRASVNIGSIALTNATLILSTPGPPLLPHQPPPPHRVRPPVQDNTRTITPVDSAYAAFQTYTAQQFASPGFLQQASMGGCLVADNNIPLFGWNDFAPLYAGPQINVDGPDGALALTSLGSGTYVEESSLPPVSRLGGGGVMEKGPGGPVADSSATWPPIIPPAGGTFTFENGSGGSGVGPFTATLTEDFRPSLRWRNRDQILTVQRDRGQLITWTGGAPGSYVEISGYSSGPVGSEDYYYVYFTCSAPVSAGQFMVPAAVLKSLPQSIDGGPNLTRGHLYVTNKAVQRFSAPGLDLGLMTISMGSGISVPFE